MFSLLGLSSPRTLLVLGLAMLNTARFLMGFHSGEDLPMCQLGEKK